MPNVVKSIDGKIIYTGIKMEMMVPDEYFKTGFAEEIGTGYKIFGNLITYHYTDDKTERKDAKKAFLYYPLMFFTEPDDVNIETLDINGKGEEKYRVLTYHKNSVLMTSDEMIQDAGNMEYFVKMLMGGKFDIIKYSKIPKMMQLAKLYNNINFEVPAMYEEVMISDYYRDPNNIKRPARFAAAEEPENKFYAKGITIREKVAFTSTFSAFTFEDINSMITMADNAKRENKKEIISEVEKYTLDLY